MGQKNTRIDDSALESQVVSTKEALPYNIDPNESQINKDSQTDQVKSLNLSLKRQDNIDHSRKNQSDTFPSRKFSNARSTSMPKQAKQQNENSNQLNKINIRPSIHKTFVNNFYVFINKENTLRNNSNRSVSYYIPERKILIEKLDQNGILNENKRSKSISELSEDLFAKTDSSFSEYFTPQEVNTISLTYKFIKDDLSNVGVIAFMKSFETLPDMKNKFDTFKFLPIDELSKSHALRTHSKKVMNIIDEFVNALKEDQLDQMKQKLFKLGERHHIYRAKKEYFMVIEYQFINAIRPIITKNLQIIEKNRLIETNEDFSLTFDDRFYNLSNDDLYIESFLNNDEVSRAFDFVKLIWHKVFEVIRLYMDTGMDSFEAKLKS